MVSRSRKTVPSRERLLSAAAAEFAARGFDGAKVDRIATTARINKAMIYYHFKSKANLYREVLRDVFGAVAAAVVAVRDAGGSADVQLRAFIRALANASVSRPHFPAIWLREVAEGGRHVDQSVIAEVVRVMQTLGAILADGKRDGQFGDVHPLVVQLGIVAPLLLFAATSPVRERLGDRAPAGVATVSRDAMIAHVEATTLAALSNAASPGPRRSAPVRTTSTRRSRV
jgi:TetR/AcrR family transcriptional regulator